MGDPENHVTVTGEELLTPDEVCQFFKISKRTRERWLHDGRIPKPIKVGPQQNRWLRSECMEALNAMIAASRPGGPV
jgi:excisionase family DNA binding protein